MQSEGFAQGEAAMNRVHEQAQQGIDDPAGFREQNRNGQGWEDDPSEETDASEPDDTPGAGNGEQEQNQQQNRDQLQDGSGAQQGPNPTPGSGNGNGGGGNGGPGGGN
jgi:hypothetical protein